MCLTARVQTETMKSQEKRETQAVEIGLFVLAVLLSALTFIGHGVVSETLSRPWPDLLAVGLLTFLYYRLLRR